jgi:Ca-activated chloride channel family protein
MKRRRPMRNFAVTGVVSFLLCPFIGSPRDDRPREDYVFRSEVRLVLLDVSVKDRAGGFVRGLSKENFDVLENNESQQITVFANNDLPATVGILVDQSRSMAPKRADVLAAAETFIQESNPRDEFFVLNFNDTVKRGLPSQIQFSDNIKQLRSALYRGIPEGKTALNDAIVDGLKQLELGTRGRKALIVISDGGDNASQHKRQKMLDMVEGNTASVYTIGLFDADDPDRNPGILKRLAKSSGGEAYFPESASRMESVCRGIAEDIRARYTIGYLPRASNGAGTRRHIRVFVKYPGHPKLTAWTRASYRYEELAHPSDK